MAGRVIAGYAAVWWNPDDPGTEGIADDGTTRLRVARGAFDESLKRGEVQAWYAHRGGKFLGGQEDGNLRLGVDAVGLWYELRPINVDGWNVVKRIDRRKLAGSSWQGRVTDSRTFREGGLWVCEYTAVDLIEIGPCREPRFQSARCWVGDADADAGAAWVGADCELVRCGMQQVRRRYAAGGAAAAPRLTTRTGGGDTITGYASVFYRPGDPSTEYQLSEGLVERILPGAFDRALKDDDVRALFNHDPSKVLGRTRSGTCKLTVDAVGLRYEIAPPNTPTGNEVLELLRRGDVSGSSFAFIPRRVTHQREGAVMIEEVRDVQLFDVGPVVFPAYAGTEAEAGARSAASDLAAIDAARISMLLAD